jgi:uncharacterized protein YdaL
LGWVDVSTLRIVRGRKWAAITTGLCVAVSGTAFLAFPGAGNASGRHGSTAAKAPATPGTGSVDQTGALPGPPKPPSGHPRQPAIQPKLLSPVAAHRQATAEHAVQNAVTTQNTKTAPALPAGAKSWGTPGSATTLVLYDTTDTYGWLGELYGLAAGNLASHFGTVTAEPVVSYTAGQMASYTSVVYLGSTYNEPVPSAFLNDVLADTTPVVWAGDNVWQLSGAYGSDADNAFIAKYGWDPSSSWFDTGDTITHIDYKGQRLTRDGADQGGILAPHIADATKVSVLASGECVDTTGAPTACASIAQTNGATSVPWALRSANLTYVGEVPFAYISESDRYLAFADLMFAADAPTAPAKHQAMVRLEDVNPSSDPSEIRADADYLSSVNVPFSIGVVPVYTDPNGTYDNGVPQTMTLAQTPALVSALKYAQSKGGTIIEHGYTHQYSTVANPYDGVTADDFEFYRSQCSVTQNPPYQYEAPCQNTDWVILEGPVPNDSQAWARNRATTGLSLMQQAGFHPNIWETPHYSASAVDYAGIDSVFSTRYERELFFGGQLSGNVDLTHVFGQFYPFLVHDAYGTTVVPEDLGNYEPEMANNHPPRLAADIIANAQANLVMTQGVASFFFHPYYPIDQLKTIVAGIQGLGYTFASPATILAGN